MLSQVAAGTFNDRTTQSPRRTNGYDHLRRRLQRRRTWETVQVVVTWLHGVGVRRHVSAAQVLTPPLVCGEHKCIHFCIFKMTVLNSSHFLSLLLLGVEPSCLILTRNKTLNFSQKLLMPEKSWDFIFVDFFISHFKATRKEQRHNKKL